MQQQYRLFGLYTSIMIYSGGQRTISTVFTFAGVDVVYLGVWSLLVYPRYVCTYLPNGRVILVGAGEQRRRTSRFRRVGIFRRTTPQTEHADPNNSYPTNPSVSLCSVPFRGRPFVLVLGVRRHRRHGHQNRCHSLFASSEVKVWLYTPIVETFVDARCFTRSVMDTRAYCVLPAHTPQPKL